MDFAAIALSCTFSQKDVFFAFYIEIQDGPPKSPDTSPDTLGVQNFAEISLSHTISKIYAFLHFTQKFKMTGKKGRKRLLEKIAYSLCKYAWGKKFHYCNRSISHHFRDKCVFAFYTNLRWLPKMVGKPFLGKVTRCLSADTLGGGQKFRRNHLISLYCFRRNFLR